ncbi:MAG TPA: ester cyclase [Vicinamibacterales bacterium]|nr:ester cyclase [Vicinamibacterales bacterium]
MTDYLKSLSGQVKTDELVARFVSDSALAEHIRQAEAAFPRYELDVEGIIAEGDLVAVRGTFRGVQRGAFADIPATGREVAAGLMIFYRIAGRRIVQHWMQFDAAGLIAQLSEAPALRA